MKDMYVDLHRSNRNKKGLRRRPEILDLNLSHQKVPNK